MFLLWKSNKEPTNIVNFLGFYHIWGMEYIL